MGGPRSNVEIRVAGAEARLDAVGRSDRRRNIAVGRRRDHVDASAEAVARNERMVNSPGFVEATLAAIGTVTDIDFSGFDLDQPLPRLTTNGEQGSLDKFAQWGSGKTLRQLARERFGTVPS